MKTRIILLSFLVILPISHAWAVTDLITLGSPTVSISSNTGAPGSLVTITVSHIPDISKTSYPYPDLYIYLPFSQPFGTAISSHCGGQDCFPIYTHDNAINQDLTNRTITFALPSTSNPKPVILNGLENTVCDVTINGKTVERFSTLCNTKNEPQGTYDIKIGWVLETDLDQKYTTNTIPFQVIGNPLQISSSPVADNGNTILKEYQNGTISQAQFYQDLRLRGWTDEQIRQALAVIGKLPHQMGVPGPDAGLPNNNTMQITNQTIPNTNNTSQPIVPIKAPVNITKVSINETKTNPIPENTTTSKENTTTSQIVYTTTQTNSTQMPARNNFMWNEVVIGLSSAAAAIMAGVVIFVKTHRGKHNA